MVRSTSLNKPRSERSRSRSGAEVVGGRGECEREEDKLAEELDEQAEEVEVNVGEGGRSSCELEREEGIAEEGGPLSSLALRR